MEGERAMVSTNVLQKLKPYSYSENAGFKFVDDLYLSLHDNLPEDLRPYWEELFQSSEGKHLYIDFQQKEISPADFLQHLTTRMERLHVDCKLAEVERFRIWNPVVKTLLLHMQNFPFLRIRNNLSLQLSTSKIEETKVCFRKKILSSHLLTAILQQLTTVMISGNLYQNDGHKFINCKHGRNCQFCRDMFKHISISACSIRKHDQCTDLGWYPHVGPELWQLLKAKHDSKAVFLSKARATRFGDIPCLAHYLN